MAPTIVFQDGRPLLALGSPGGATIITTVLQTLLNRLDFGLSLPDAVAAPRASQRNARPFRPKPRSSPPGPPLQALGHVFGTNTAEIGAVTGIELLDNGKLLAVAEPVRRGGGSAGVVRPHD